MNFNIKKNPTDSEVPAYSKHLCFDALFVSFLSFVAGTIAVGQCMWSDFTALKH